MISLLSRRGSKKRELGFLGIILATTSLFYFLLASGQLYTERDFTTRRTSDDAGFEGVAENKRFFTMNDAKANRAQKGIRSSSTTQLHPF